MRLFWCLIACCACLFLFAPARSDEPAAAKAKAKALLLLEQEKRARADSPTDYESARREAERTKRPLLILVNCKRPDLLRPDWVIVSVEKFGDVKTGIVVSEGGYWVDTLPPSASAVQIEKTIRPWK